MKDFTHRLINNKWAVRVTHMLSQVNAKGKGFEYFLKKYGEQADEIAHKAAESGTKVHKVCEHIIKKRIEDRESRIEIKPKEWALDKTEILKLKGFLNFIADYEPTFKDSEIDVCDGQCSGRADIVCEIKGEPYIVDIKCGSSLWDDHYMQVSFYCKAYTPEQPGLFRPAILHLKDSTKKGYQFTTIDYEKWVKGYELSYQMYVLRGFPLEPAKEDEEPEVLTLEV